MGSFETTQSLEDEIRERVLQTDIAILNEHGVGDKAIALLAAEHAARCETFSKMIEPTFGRSILLLVAGAMLAAADQINDATIPEQEIVHVGA